MRDVPHPIATQLASKLDATAAEAPAAPPVSPQVLGAPQPPRAVPATPLVLPLPPSAPEPPTTGPAAGLPVIAPPEPEVEREPVRGRERAARPPRRLHFSRPRHRRNGSERARVVGLKIGSSQLAAACVVDDGSPELRQLARRPLEPGIVVAGELRDPPALTAALAAFFRETRLPRQGVRIGIASSRIAVRIVEIAGVDDPQQLSNAVRFRAQEVLPVPLDEMAVDHRVLSEHLGADGLPVQRVLLVVAYRDLVEPYAQACFAAGLDLVGIDLEAFALLRAVAAPLPRRSSADGAALVAVAIGHDCSTLAISDGSVCELARVLDWGGSTLDGAVARELGLSPAQAEPVRRALALGGSANVPGGMSAEAAGRAREAMRHEVQTLARELVASLHFYQSGPGSLGLGEIVVTGGVAHTPGLATELEQLIGVSVRVADPLARVRVAGGLTEPAQLGSLAVAIGLGIED